MRLYPPDQRYGLRTIMRLSWGDDKIKRIAKGITDSMDLARKPTAGAA